MGARFGVATDSQGGDDGGCSTCFAVTGSVPSAVLPGFAAMRWLVERGVDQFHGASLRFRSSDFQFFGITRKIRISSHDTTGTQDAESGDRETSVTDMGENVTNHGRLLG